MTTAVRLRSQPLLSPEATLMVTGALGTWMGVQALRWFFAMVVMNVTEHQQAYVVGLTAFGLYTVGLCGWLAARYVGGPEPARRFGVWTAGLAVLRQVLPGEYLSPALAIATLIVWLWWLPAFLQQLARRNRLRLLPPALLLGLGLQAAGQTAMHGLDLPFLRGGWAVLLAMVVAGGFVLAMWQGHKATPADGPDTGAFRGALALGPYFFLQITLLTNSSRLQDLYGLDARTATLQILAALVAAMVALRLSPSRWTRLLTGAAGVGLLLPGVLGAGPALVLVQAMLAVGLAAAFAPAPPIGRANGYTGHVLGGLLLLLFLFLYYGLAGWPLAWPLAAGLILVVALLPQAVPALGEWPPLGVLAAAVAIGFTISLVPAPGPAPITEPAPAELKLLTYNIHQGLDAFSAPAMQALARTIETADADLVALQEVPRGFDMSGGMDATAYLQWRFPQYRVYYGTVPGAWFGNVVMSKYPVRASGAVPFDRNAREFARGLTYMVVPTAAGDLRWASTHLVAFDGSDDGRAGQARALATWWAAAPRTVIAGDLNARPEQEPIKVLLDAGLRDMYAPHGNTPTHPAQSPRERIDYLFGSPDVTSVSAAVLTGTLTSDHLPVVSVIQLR